MIQTAPNATAQAPLETTTALVLAAGQGTRMKSVTPKVLHPIAGRPLVYYPVRAALEAGCGQVVVVVGHGAKEVAQYLSDTFGALVETTLQAEQRGTGDAARVGLGAARADAQRVLVFYGDVPLVMAADVAAVARALDEPSGGVLAIATCEVDEPFGYGRILRDVEGRIVEIREQRDVRSEAERKVREINPGIYAATRSFLQTALAALRPNNAQGELYLTDIVSYAASAGKVVVAVPSRAEVLVGINDRDQLAVAEASMCARIAKRWRIAGVTVRGDARIDDAVELASDVTVESGAVLRGTTRVGRGSFIDVGCVLTNVEVGELVRIQPYSVLTDSSVGARAQIGPFSHLRPDNTVGEDVHIGNFVELKKTRLARGAKANHLSYLGDGIIGENVNIGAGTIFCNYDGVLKHTTVIDAGAFIGSDSQLVAPVRVGAGAYVATGTTVTKDVPANALAIARTKQENKDGYAERLRTRLKARKEQRKGT